MSLSSEVEGAAVVPISFSIVGVQKAGTSTLAELLVQHPQVARAAKKELHYFDDETRSWDPPDHTGYHAVRRDPAERVAGDNTPRYLFHPHALRRMRDFDPDLRLMAIFRDPIERVFSQWAMQRERSETAPDWPRFIRAFRPDSLPQDFPEGVRPTRFLNQSGVARGYYGAQLRRGFEIFDRTQWLLLEFRSFLADHADVLDRVTDHLGIDRFDSAPELVHKMPAPSDVHGTPPTGAQLADLAELYRDDLALFVKLSGLDVSSWPTTRILDGTLAPDELAAKLGAKLSASTG